VNAEEASEPLYAYAVVRAASLPKRLSERGLVLVTSGSVAVLFAPLGDSPVETSRRNVLAHADVLEDAFASMTILPMRFGTVFPNQDAVRASVLEPNARLLESMLAAHENTVELALKASYDQEAVLAEITRGDARVRRLRDRYRGAATLDAGLALGEEVAAALGRRRDRDATRVLDSLVPLAADVRVGDVVLENGVVNVSFLIDRENLESFDTRLEELSRELSPPIRFRLTGPLPPYSFVDVPLPAVA
jgi:hypothetical protein